MIAWERYGHLVVANGDKHSNDSALGQTNIWSDDCHSRLSSCHNALQQFP